MQNSKQSLSQCLQTMKDAYERAITEGNYTNLIRSQNLINILRDFVIGELCDIDKIKDSWIAKDKKVYGFPKKKEQDILVQPPQDIANSTSVGPIIAINIRSQLSSIEKNYDTLFERIFAEALNLHNRFPYMILAYMYLLPLYGYNTKKAQEKEVVLDERYDLEKYILSFLSISGRKEPIDAPWKYEKVCLLIVDFSQNPPCVLDDMCQFFQRQLVSRDFLITYSSRFKDISINTFFDDIKNMITERYYLLLKER